MAGPCSAEFLINTRDRNLQLRSVDGTQNRWIETINQIAEEARNRDTRVF
jgi:hypothetical protein